MAVKKNLKYLKNLEKQKAESKIINKLTINGKAVSNQTDILNEQMKYYQKLYETEIS